MRLIDSYPLLALNAPGKKAVIRIDVGSDEPASIVARVELLDRGVAVGGASTSAHIEWGNNKVDVTVQVPADDARGYQVLVTLENGASATATGTTAILCAHHWRSVPRYGFLSDFVLQDNKAPPVDAVRELAKFHITIVQFYDWMYRHYQFLPPRLESGSFPGTFKDGMGREVAPAVVLQRVDECKAHGMAPIAYGAVYGPEPEFIRARPDWLLYDAAGKPLSLIDLFYITDLRPGPWREHIMGEFEAAISEAGFSGIHMDQYGMPKLAYDVSGTLVNPAGDFASMIDEAAGRVRELDPEAGVIFNAVNDWPIDHVARADQEAVYIEVWSPHDTYRDLTDLIRRSRDLSGKQTILSAYLLPFHQGGSGAEWALRYITAIINVAGGHHLILGEGSAVLREPYYPDHGRLSDDGVGIIRRYYDHSAALTHYLHASDLHRVARTFTTGINNAFQLKGAPASSVPEKGSVWVSVAQRPGQFVLNLVNLTSVQDDRWNIPQPEALQLSGLLMILEPFLKISRVTWISPDVSEDSGGMAAPLEPLLHEEGTIELRLPALQLWATIIVDHE